MKDIELINFSPRISIITSTYNAERFLEECIGSVVNQTYSNIEYIVIDGGSKDSTVKIINKYRDQISYWLSEPDKGIYDAWNKALRVATGDWICFIGADDFFNDHDTLSKIVPQLSTIKDKKYVYGKLFQIPEDGSRVIEVLGKPWNDSKIKFHNEMTLAHCGALHHRSLFEINGGFNTKFRIAGDYEFLLREFCKNDEFAIFIDVPFASMRNGGISGSLKNRLLMARETNEARKLNGITSISFTIWLWIARIRFYMIIRTVLGDKLTNRLADGYRSLIGKRKRWSL